MLSAISMVGLILGYSLGGHLVQRYGVKVVLLFAHVGFAVLNFVLLGVRTGRLASVMVLAATLGVYGVLVACASIAVSSQLLTLASPANKAVSIAFGYSLYAAGQGG